RRKFDDSQHLPPDQRYGRLVHRDLRGGLFHPDLRPKIDHQDEGGLPRFGKNLGLDHRPHPDVDPLEIGVGNLLAHRPSSSLLSLAASTVFSMRFTSPFGAISTPSAASVVPLGEVTFCRSTAAGDGSASSSAAAPMIVWRASCIACSGSNPCRTPAAASASTKWKTYAGPDPDTAVTASIIASSSNQRTCSAAAS